MDGSDQYHLNNDPSADHHSSGYCPVVAVGMPPEVIVNSQQICTTYKNSEKNARDKKIIKWCIGKQFWRNV